MRLGVHLGVPATFLVSCAQGCCRQGSVHAHLVAILCANFPANFPKLVQYILGCFLPRKQYARKRACAHPWLRMRSPKPSVSCPNPLIPPSHTWRFCVSRMRWKLFEMMRFLGLSGLAAIEGTSSSMAQMRHTLSSISRLQGWRACTGSA